MNKFQYINHNGQLLKKETFQLDPSNRAFLYGDGLFETLHANGTICQFLDSHYHRLTYGLQELKINIPSYFTVKYFEEQISSLLNKNRIYKGARIRFTAYRDSKGFYTPTSNDLSFLITAEELKEEQYILNSKGLIVDFYTEDQKTINRFSNLKTINGLFYVMAGLYKTEKDVDECIILNKKGAVCETISSNIFIVENDNIYTPALSDGCIAGVMRKNVIRLAKNNGFKITDYESIDVSRIKLADEIFITNAVKGIQWVVAYGRKRYFNFISKKLNILLNQEAFNSK